MNLNDVVDKLTHGIKFQLSTKKTGNILKNWVHRNYSPEEAELIGSYNDEYHDVSIIRRSDGKISIRFFRNPIRSDLVLLDDMTLVKLI